MKKILSHIQLIHIVMYVLSIQNYLSSQCIDSSKINYDNIEAFCYLDIDEHPTFYKPVCGCDQITYMNVNCAVNHGITHWTEGTCDCFESKWIMPHRVNFLNYIINPFNIPRQQVCGCDNVTYLNPSSAHYSGITQWNEGVCSCIDSSVIDYNFNIEKCSGSKFTYQNLDMEIPYLMGCDGKFYKNICEAFYYHGVTRFVLVFDCKILPESEWNPDFECPDKYDPVCGCDGVTYRNECVAKNHKGIVDFYAGECNCINSDLIGSSEFCKRKFELDKIDPVCGCDGKTYLNQCQANNDHGIFVKNNKPCSCLDTSYINHNIECNHLPVSPWCGCDGKIYKNRCEAYFYHGVLDERECNCIEPGLIDIEKNCNEFINQDLVCGCDNKTYPNECYATFKAGVTHYNSLLKGPCSGTCKDTLLAIPDFPCSDFDDPVCGCDNHTYQNECVARYKFGVIKWKKGKCTSKINDIASTVRIQFYPNPATDNIVIICDDKYVFTDIEILGARDEKIMKINKEVLNGSYIDLSNISKSGVYFIKLQSSTNIATLKVIVMK